MMTILSILQAEFRERLQNIKSYVTRNIQFPNLPNKIKVAIGMRRVGKTYFLFQTIRSLIQEQNIPLQRILYLNFEDDRLMPCSQQKFRELLEDFYKLYPDNHDQTCYFFLDEIQNVENWALVVRRFFDTKKIQIYLTGSSAKLLSKEIATSLRGRSIAIEVWPFSFEEYLAAYQITTSAELFSQKIQDQLSFHLKNYLIQGGFPEVIQAIFTDSRQVLQDYTELVIMRDIVERYNITNHILLRYLIKTLLKNTGSGFTINKFSKDIKSQGLIGAKNTLYDYLSYIEDAYLNFLLPIYSESIRKVWTNPRKIYSIDSGLVNAFTFSLNNNFGHLFENLIYLDLRRAGHKVFYYLTEERYEVDFLTEDRQGKRRLFQIVWDTSNKETLEREMRALAKAEKELNIPGILMTPIKYIEMIFNHKSL